MPYGATLAGVVAAALLCEALVAWIGRRPAYALFVAAAATAVLVLLRRARVAEGRAEEGRARVAALSEQAPIGIFQTSTRGDCRFVNERWRALTGLTDEESYGRGWLAAIHPDDRERVAREWDDAARAAREFRSQYRFRTPDGRETWVEGRAVALRNRRGRITGFLGTVADVTDRRRTEAELRAGRDALERLYEAERRARAEAEAAQSRLAFLAEASSALASSLDYGQTVATVARLAVGRLADYCCVDVAEPDGAMRRLVAMHVDPAMEPLMERLRSLPPTQPLLARGARVVRTGEPDVVNDIDLARAAPSIPEDRRELVLALRPRAYMVLPLRGHRGTFGTMTFVSSDPDRRYHRADVTLARELAGRAAIAIENARLHDAERAARAAAEAADHAKNEFLSVVSHELRTPLASMLGWLRVLRSATGAPSARALDTLERNVRVQRKLIEDLVDVSRMVTGRLHVEMRPVDLLGVVRAAVDAMRIEAELKQIHLDASLDALPGPVAGDPERLEQIVLNLLSNAVKFTPAGGRVDVRLEAVGARARLAVRDTGRGIAAEFLPYVFDRFRQADGVADRGRERGGLGLGLAITRHLVERHGGTIDVRSDGEGTGATFTVVLPLVVAPVMPAEAGVGPDLVAK